MAFIDTTSTGVEHLLQVMRLENVSVLLHGPSASGKTTIATNLLDELDCNYSVVNASVEKLTELKAKAERYDALVIDEAQYLNRRNQQALLPIIDTATCRLVLTTTDTSAFDEPLLSRLFHVRMRKARAEELNQLGLPDDERVRDIFRALDSNLRLFNTYASVAQKLFGAPLWELSDTQLQQVSTVDLHDKHRLDKLISALQKSIRGSDASAAIIWAEQLARLGAYDVAFRRLLVIACEDIGLSDPDAIVRTLALHQAFHRVGEAEGRYFLVQAAADLATTTKSNSISAAISAAKALPDLDPPENIAYAHGDKYDYPFDHPGNWSNQPYLPEGHNVKLLAVQEGDELRRKGIYLNRLAAYKRGATTTETEGESC